MRLLVVEDEIDLAFLIKKGLQKEGYAIDIANDGEEALFLYQINDYDLIVLDLNLPLISGLEILRRIRKTDFVTKVLILSAYNSVEDRVTGLDLGANDYLIKPFDFKELAARIRTLLRINFSLNPTILSVGDLSLNLDTKKATIKQQEIALTKKEFSILEYLLRNKNQVISKEMLIEHVWDNETNTYDSALKFHLHSLRKKLSHQYIQNVFNQGYIIKDS